MENQTYIPIQATNSLSNLVAHEPESITEPGLTVELKNDNADETSPENSQIQSFTPRANKKNQQKGLELSITILPINHPIAGSTIINAVNDAITPLGVEITNLSIRKINKK